MGHRSSRRTPRLPVGPRHQLGIVAGPAKIDSDEVDPGQPGEALLTASSTRWRRTRPPPSRRRWRPGHRLPQPRTRRDHRLRRQLRPRNHPRRQPDTPLRLHHRDPRPHQRLPRPTPTPPLDRPRQTRGHSRGHPLPTRRIPPAPTQPNPPHRGTRHPSPAAKTPPAHGRSTWSARVQRRRTTLTCRERRPPSRAKRCRQPLQRGLPQASHAVRKASAPKAGEP
jgi:hypothetical protein